MERNPMAESTEKLIQAIKTAYSAMDDLVYHMDIVKTCGLRGLNTQNTSIEEVMTYSEAEKVILRQQTHEAILGGAALVGAVEQLMEKGNQVISMGASLAETLQAVNNEVYKLAEPLYIEATAQEFGISNEEAFELLSAPLTEEEQEALKQGIPNIVNE